MFIYAPLGQGPGGDVGRESRKRPVQRRSWGALSALLSLAAAISTGGCGASPFVTATDRFAQATLSGADVLSPSFATASSVCHMRARMHFLATRELGDNDTEWTAWYARHKLG